jgi:hypothetical protein
MPRLDTWKESTVKKNDVADAVNEDAAEKRHEASAS